MLSGRFEHAYMHMYALVKLWCLLLSLLWVGRYIFSILRTFIAHRFYTRIRCQCVSIYDALYCVDAKSCWRGCVTRLLVSEMYYMSKPRSQRGLWHTIEDLCRIIYRWYHRITDSLLMKQWFILSCYYLKNHWNGTILRTHMHLVVVVMSRNTFYGLAECLS